MFIHSLLNSYNNPCIYLFNYLFIDDCFPIDCSDDEGRFFNNYTTVVDGKNVIIGIPLGCSFGAWAAVCNDGTNSANVADIICKNAGFSGKS